MQLLEIIWSQKPRWGKLLTNEGDWWCFLVCHETFQNSFWSGTYIIVSWTSSWCHLFSPFIEGYHWSKFRLYTLSERWRKVRLDSPSPPPPPSNNRVCKLFIRRANIFKNLKTCELVCYIQLLTVPHLFQVYCWHFEGSWRSTGKRQTLEQDL